MRCKMRDVATPFFHHEMVQINDPVPKIRNKVVL
jgi:hypothetical protein